MLIFLFHFYFLDFRFIVWAWSIFSIFSWLIKLTNAFIHDAVLEVFYESDHFLVLFVVHFTYFVIVKKWWCWGHWWFRPTRDFRVKVFLDYHVIKAVIRRFRLKNCVGPLSDKLVVKTKYLVKRRVETLVKLEIWDLIGFLLSQRRFGLLLVLFHDSKSLSIRGFDFCYKNWLASCQSDWVQQISHRIIIN